MFCLQPKFRLSYRRTLLPFLLSLLFVCSPAWATDAQDISIGLKALLMMGERPSGVVNVAIVYDSASPESETDAESIKSKIDSGVGVPSGLKLATRLINISELDKLSDVKLVFLASGISPAGFDPISKASSSGILTISTDIACVRTNKCVLGIVSRPSVAIYYSAAAAEAAHISFVSSFLMLVKQI